MYPLIFTIFIQGISLSAANSIQESCLCLSVRIVRTYSTVPVPVAGIIFKAYLVLLWSVGGSRSLRSLKALGRPNRPSSPAHCSKVHRTFFQRSRPRGFDPPTFHSIKKTEWNEPILFFVVERRGIEPLTS